MMSGNKDRKIFEEIMAEHFPNLLKNINLHISEAQWMPSRISARHIIVKFLKDNRGNRESRKEKKKSSCKREHQ